MLQEKDLLHTLRDGAELYSVQADVAQVKASRDEFMLLFGAAQKEQPNKNEFQGEQTEKNFLTVHFGE